mmetsp:Transcript_21913/g.44399  ORF Transcript_21913/g.44399 Transcript_21913/m.44399 type:complete len:291 (-) Transcript_21913:75-947(-)
MPPSIAPTALWSRLQAANPFFLISGPNVLQGKDHALRLANHIAKLKAEYKLEIVFKSSFDKANRTSLGSFRGPGLDEGLKILEAVKKETGLPVITDIHESHQAAAAAEVVDIIQIPAFLCRQTDLLTAAAATGLPLHIKKGQFASPQALQQAARKVGEAGNGMVLLGERGTTFGYSDLVVDPRSIVIMQEKSHMVVMDVTHCLQQPSARPVDLAAGGGLVSGGERALLPHMGAMALSLGAHGVFVEVDDNPSPPCDGKLQWPLAGLSNLIRYWLPFAEARAKAGDVPVAG